MSCFFCNSSSHLSHFCEKYESDESRQSRIEDIRCCRKCLTMVKKKKKENHSATWCRFFSTRCFLCFSTGHRTVFCRERFNNAPNIFIPKIDDNLLSRFLQTFDSTEKILLRIMLPKRLHLITLDRLKVVRELRINRDNYNRNTVVSNNIFIEQLDLDSDFSSLIASRSVIIKARIVELRNVKMTAENFLLFFSPFLKILKCSNLSMTSNIKFSEILRKTPAIQSLEFESTFCIEIENSWPSLLLKYVNGNMFTTLKILINDLNFCLEDLVTFITTKCSTDVQITLQLKKFPGFTHEKVEEEIVQKLSNYFIETKATFDKIPRLFLFVEDNENFFTQYNHSFGCYTLKPIQEM